MHKCMGLIEMVMSIAATDVDFADEDLHMMQVDLLICHHLTIIKIQELYIIHAGFDTRWKSSASGD